MNWNKHFFAICLAALTRLPLPLDLAGQTWNVQTTGIAFNAVWMLENNTGWIVAFNGLILHTTDGWATRTAQA